ncbi:hypothetical protein [Streptomyces lydicus]|uniref:hypothetical protein n=1 Tax=Streptomyces lydicus TaxID=47763 RepID=UPI00371E62B5
MLNSWLGWFALAALIAIVISGLLAWWGSRLGWWGPRSRSGPLLSIGDSYETVLIASMVSPFVAAFASKLGERLGTTVRIKRISWLQRLRRGRELVVALPFDRAITIEVRRGLSDEARLALLDLDVDQPELYGHRLRWDDEVKAWLPVPEVSDSEDAD